MATTDETPVLHTYIVERGLNICINKEICEKKQEILHNFYKKFSIWENSTILSQYYINALELLKFIDQYIMNNDTFLKSDIYYNNSMIYKLSDMLSKCTITIFAYIMDDIDMDINEEEISNYVDEIEEIVGNLTSNQDFTNIIM